MQQWRVLPQPPPRSGLRRPAQPLREPGRALRSCAGPVGERQQLRNQCVGVLGGQPGHREAVTQPGGTQRRLHGLMKGPEIVDVDRVQRDPHETRLDDLMAGEGSVEVGRVEAGEPVPQREVGRRRLLRLQCDHAPYRIPDAERLPLQQQLPGKRGAVEPSRRDSHAVTVSFPMSWTRHRGCPRSTRLCTLTCTPAPDRELPAVGILPRELPCMGHRCRPVHSSSASIGLDRVRPGGAFRSMCGCRARWSSAGDFRPAGCHGPGPGGDLRREMFR